MVLWGNENRGRFLQNALVKSKNCWLIPKSAANLCECNLVYFFVIWFFSN
jgi:hypothetical protein